MRPQKQTPPTVTIGEDKYFVEDLTEEIQQFIDLHGQASEQLVSAQRQAVIAEASVAALSDRIVAMTAQMNSTEEDESAEIKESPEVKEV